MNVHQFAMLINENRELYSEEEFEELCNQWQKEYQEGYLMGQMKKFATPKI